MLEVIRNRRSIRKYTDQIVSDENIKEILEAAMMAPTARNKQEWRFLVVTNPIKLKKIAQVSPNLKMADGCAFSIIVMADKIVNPDFERVDAGAAIENMLLQAYSMGIGSCWCALDAHQERINGIIDIFPEIKDYMIIASVQFGYPNEERTVENRYDEKKVMYSK